MKFIVSSTLLLSHLQTISRVINSKNSMAILDNFLFRLEGTRLSMTASDQETTMTTAIDVMEAHGEGVFAVNAKILLEPLKELPDQPLTFEIDDNNLEIFLHFQNGRYNFIGVNGDEYPTKMPMDPSAVNLSLDAQQLLNGIGCTLFATAEDELRPVMNGIYLDIFEDSISFVASDTHKLVRFKNQAVAPGVRASFILPKKPANLLKSILPKEYGNVELSFDSKNACFKLSDFVLNCRLIPDYRPRVVCERAAPGIGLCRCCPGAGQVATEKRRAARLDRKQGLLHLGRGEGGLQLHGRRPHDRFQGFVPH